VGALIAAGLVLFVLTLAVNALARAVVERAGRKMAGDDRATRAKAAEVAAV
jgi:hypothetical protein